MHKIKKEILRFIIVGCCAVLTDGIVYSMLNTNISLSLAKGISFFAGTIVAYIFNKYWTFEVKDKSYKEMLFFIILYITTLIVNVGVNKVTLALSDGIVFFAFLCATGTSTILNFLGQKFFIFKIKSNSPSYQKR